MKMKHLTTLVCAGSLFAVSAFAQQDPTTTQPGSATGRDNPSSSVTTPGSMGSPMSMGSDFRASKAIGADVKSSTGDKLGKIEDLLFNQQGRVQFAVINHDNKLYPLPWQLLNSSTTGATGIGAPTGQELSFTAQVDKTKLEAGPTIDRSRWSEITQPGFDQRVWTHYGVQSGMGGAGFGTDKSSGMGTGSGQDLNKDQNKDLNTPPTTPDTTPSTPDSAK